ncbi:hypothetical protein PanWU01x14_135500 [Parasponia andersonii]|uniref:Uncharacterized protein n=1 Tax=Parasponia andersonii TaxID=3476 RepID=A0A2P5CPA3_PARAD|nr:hypothetical protein PanWU01x14_135500 [Parasponia andersonii]
MGLEMELDFEKNRTVGLSPNTVLPSQQNCSFTRKSSTKGRLSRKDELLILQGDFREISFSRYRSISCKNMPSRPVTKECNVEFKRGSVYQSSKEVRKMKTMGTVGGRKKIEVSRNSDISFSIVDSLCSSDEENPKRRSPAISFDSNSLAPSVSKPYVKPHTSDGFIEICLDPGSRGNNSTESVGGASMDSNLRSEPVVGPLRSSNELLERDAVRILHKSVSAKVELPASPSQSESDCSSKARSKARFSPIRKMFDPFMKSKSLRSPLSYAVEPDEVRTTGLENMRTNRTYRKSLMQSFSDRAQESECESQFIKSNNQSSISCSPFHLHGYLKVENKHGLPFFEFSLKCPEDVFVAKTWRAKDAFKWVYTFHLIDGGKKSNANRWGLFDSDKDSSMVGQMQVSCYLCSELKEGVFDNSMVTEFVLYDIAHARLSVTAQENSDCTLDSNKVSKGSDQGLAGAHSGEVKVQQKHVSGDDESSHSNPYPWTPANLHPSLEVAAIVMQAPFEKRESLKYKRGDMTSEKTHKNLLNLTMAEQWKKQGLSDGRTPDKVKVVIPAGNHGLPSDESGRPSSLLNRWRLGGGCDCGGWDMACPLTVLGNPHFQCANSQSIMENQLPMELFVQGAKDNTPALTMTVIEEGLYAVDFHAQLSTLQAFSICVAILHGTETSLDAGEERNKELPQGSSLKVLIEEEVKFLIEAVTAQKRNVTKRVKEIPPSYVLNPPFSPIARV